MADSPQQPVLPALAPVRGSPRRFATARTIMALILREMSTRYGRTPGGYLWTVVPVERRTEYMEALEAASVRRDIVPFTRFLGGLLG